MTMQGVSKNPAPWPKETYTSRDFPQIIAYGKPIIKIHTTTLLYNSWEYLKH